MSVERIAPLPPTSLEPVYLTPDQVGELLQVKVKTIYSWSRDDATMPVIRIGHTVRFPRERLLRWLQDREQGRARPRRVQTPAGGAIPAGGGAVQISSRAPHRTAWQSSVRKME